MSASIRSTLSWPCTLDGGCSADAMSGRSARPVDSRAGLARRRSIVAGVTLGICIVSTFASVPSKASERTVEYAGHAWRVEQEAAGTNVTVQVKGDDLVLDTPRGLTVWLATPLHGHYEIRYSRTVVERGGVNDRLSDLNQFWMANTVGSPTPDTVPSVAPAAASRAASSASASASASASTAQRSLSTAGVLGRSGRLADYDALSMYYFGFGGNRNTTTRFRRYDGTTSRPLLQEYLDADHLLRANHRYRIRTIVDARGTRVYIDGKQYFRDAARVPDSGYFAFRTTQSHQIISAFLIRKLR